ncbi:PAS domain S-box protein [Chloroflexota bacterium]
MVNKNVKILLIEDNPGDARLIREMLAEAPDASFELETAKRLSTGLKHLAKEATDVILLDIGLPDSQGLDTVNKVYAQVKTVPIVVLTGLEDESVGMEAVQHGAQDYLVKGQIQSKALWRVINYSIERKRAGEMLRQSEERYRTLFNSKLDGMCVIDETMKVLLANQAAADMFGFDSIDDLLDANPFDFIPLEERERILAVVAKDLFENDLRKVNEFRLKDKSGKDVWVGTIGTLTEYQDKLAGLISFRDITDRKRLEEHLEKERQEFKLIVDSSPIIVFYKDIKGRFVRVNKALAQALKIPEEQFVGKTAFDFYSNKIAQGMTNDDQEVFKSGRPKLNIIEQYESASGLRWVQTDKVPIFDENGVVIGLVGFAQDITERRQAEEALVDEATRRRILVEQSSDGIVVLDGSGKVYESNRRFAEMLGYSLEEVRELHMWDWDTQSTRGQLLEKVRTVDEAGDHFETSHRRKDGTVYDVEISTNGAVIAGQKLVFCVCRDITERKRMEKEVSASRDYLDRIINNMGDVLVVLDTDYNIRDVNERFLKYYGGELKDIVGRKCYEVLYQLSEPCSKVQRRCPLETVLKTGKPFATESIYKTVEGHEFTFELSMFPLLNADGNIEALVEIQHDVTVRKQMEESLRLSEQNLRDSIENSLVGIRVLDKDGKTIYANRALLDIWGYGSIEELEAVPAKQRYTPESYAEHMNRAEKGRWGAPDVISYETSIVRPDGQVRHISASTRELMWGGEKQVQAVYQDITDRKKAEAEYRTFVGATMDGFWLTDMQGHFLDVNEAYCSLVGYSRDELLNMSIPDVEAIEKSEDTAEHIRKVKKVGHDRFETRHRRKDGGIFDVEVGVNYLSTGGGRLFVFLRDITERKRMEEELRHNVERFKNAMEGVIQVIASIVEVRDPYTAGHQRRVAELACAIAKEMGFPEERVEEIRMAALIHDIGKIYVPAEILSKPSRLTEIEFSMIKSHPQVAYDILKSVDFPWPICKLVLQHHERMDSSGYPGGLAGEDILTGAKIMAVADVVEAMASHRPYRPALGLDKALDEISKNRGVLYDIEAADACFRVFNEKGFKFE